MDETRHGAVGRPRRAGLPPRPATVEFRQGRDRRPAQPLPRVDRKIDETHVVRRHPDRKGPWCRAIAAVPRRHPDHALELLEARTRFRFCQRQSFHSALFTPGKWGVAELAAGRAHDETERAPRAPIGLAASDRWRCDSRRVAAGFRTKDSSACAKTRRFFLQRQSLLTWGRRPWGSGPVNFSWPAIPLLPGWADHLPRDTKTAVNIKRQHGLPSVFFGQRDPLDCSSRTEMLPSPSHRGRTQA